MRTSHYIIQSLGTGSTIYLAFSQKESDMQQIGFACSASHGVRFLLQACNYDMQHTGPLVLSCITEVAPPDYRNQSYLQRTKLDTGTCDEEQAQ